MNAVRNIELLSIDLNEPLNSLCVINLSVVVFLSIVWYHEHELLNKVETIIEILIFYTPKRKLWYYFIAIRVKHSQMVENLVHNIISHILTIILRFVVTLERTTNEPI